MRKHLAIAGLLASLGAGSVAQAELWQSSQQRVQREFSLGLFSQVHFQTSASPSALMGFGQFAYGVTDWFQLETRLGLGMLDAYIGLFAKFPLFQVGNFGISTIVGIHRQLSIYLDWNLLASYELKPFEFYLSPMFNASLAVPIGLALVPGVIWNFATGWSIYVEGTLNLTGSYWAASAGLKRTFPVL